MKKLHSTIAVLLALLTTLLFSACASSGQLSVPTGIDISEDNVLSWASVRNARSYRIEVFNADSDERIEETTRRTYYSLDALQEGDYEIRLMAIGGNQNDSFSAWSETLYFHKDYTTGLVYTLTNSGSEYMISKVGTAQGVVTIEDVYRGRPVTSIGDAAFRASSKIEGIIIGNRVTTIGDSAFYQCPLLASVTIPESVTSIGASAFQGCKNLSEITLPDSITQLPQNLFSYCRALKRVEFGNQLESIGDYAFYACSALTQIVLPDTVKAIGAYAFSSTSDSALKSISFGSGIESLGEYAFSLSDSLTDVTFAETENAFTIGSNAFSHCTALKSIELPKGLVRLGTGAFYGDEALADVVIPDTVTEVGSSAFSGTALYIAQEESGEYGGLIYADKWLVAATGEAKKTLPETITADSPLFKDGVVGIGESALRGVESLVNITLPNSLKYIGSQAFYNSTALYSLLTDTRNSELESIGYGAFASCAHLGNIRLNTGLRKIGASAFANCSSVMNNTNNPQWLVPDTVESIGRYAFYGTELYTSPDPSGVIYAGNWVVGYAALTTSEIELKNTVKGIADGAFYGCADLRSITGLRYVEHLGAMAFANCSNLAFVDSLYRYLEKIEAQTFYGCSSLFSIEFPAELKEIGVGAFTRCSTLDKIDLSDTLVETIGMLAFYECSNVKSVDLGEYVETIGDYAFYGLTQVMQLTIPESARTIGERAFGWWQALETLNFSEGLESIGNFAFRNCISLTSVKIPDSVKSIGDYAFYKCTAVAAIDLGNGVERIGTAAFYMNNIEALVLPASLNYIGDHAFRECTMLRSLVLEGDIDYVGAHAFYGCYYMTVYAACDNSASDAWSAIWNSSNRSVVWNSKLAEEGYVVSVTVDAENISNLHATFAFAAPVRSGYTFLGWSTDPNATEAGYTASELRTVEYGTTLYAVWKKSAEETPALPPEEPEGVIPEFGEWENPMAQVEGHYYDDYQV